MAPLDFRFVHNQLDQLRIPRRKQQSSCGEFNICFVFGCNFFPLSIISILPNIYLQFKGEGDGGMPGFIASLPVDDVVWGVFKVVGCDDRGNLVSRRPKYIFVKYLPPAASTMKRARAGGHKGAIKQVIDAHIDIEVRSYCILKTVNIN